jgi:cell division protein FtsI/penicillin-binding protein 2
VVRWFRASLVLLGLAVEPALATGSDTPEAGLPPEPPQINLSRTKQANGNVFAATADGGWAELTLDAQFEREAARLLSAADPISGAIVAVDLRTGRILVWAERSKVGSSSLVTTPLAPAASVFKLVTTTALYERGELTPSQRVCVSGGARSIERSHLEPPQRGDMSCGPFFQALGHSRNAVFAQLATRTLMRTDLIEVAERLGFNGSIPFDFPAKVGTLNVPYNDLEFARTAAGFRGSTLSPLGGAYLASVIAHGGLAPRLRIVRRAGDYAAPAALETTGRVMGSTTAIRLAKMMEVTVDSGTAYGAFHDEEGRALLGRIRVAGKTGTLRPETRTATTSWFIGFAPSRAPRIAVSVLLQNGASYRRKAAEVARDVLRLYFEEGRGAR